MADQPKLGWSEVRSSWVSHEDAGAQALGQSSAAFRGVSAGS